MRKGELIRRIEALEKTGTESPGVWIDAPESGLDGWECLPQNDVEPEIVWRLPGEADSALKARAVACMNRLRRSGASGARVFFGLNAEGLSR